MQDEKTKRWSEQWWVYLGCLLLLVPLNWGVLALFGEDSPYRAEHGLVGLLLLAGYTLVVRRMATAPMKPLRFFALAIVPCYLGTVLPDLDIRLLGIGGHRNPIFHGAFAYFLLWALVGRRHPVANQLVRGFGVGLASHLLWDTWDYGDVRWLSGGLADRAWLTIHGLLSLVPLPCKSPEPSETTQNNGP